MAACELKRPLQFAQGDPEAKPGIKDICRKVRLLPNPDAFDGRA